MPLFGREAIVALADALERYTYGAAKALGLRKTSFGEKVLVRVSKTKRRGFYRIDPHGDHVVELNTADLAFIGQHPSSKHLKDAKDSAIAWVSDVQHPDVWGMYLYKPSGVGHVRKYKPSSSREKWLGFLGLSIVGALSSNPLLQVLASPDEAY